jgi:hephaestin
MRVRRVRALAFGLVLAVGGACGAPASDGGPEVTAADDHDGGKVREYFIAADEVEWDYAPANKNLVTGEDFGENEGVFVAHGPDRIGRIYKKAVFRAYTDDSFTQLVERPAQWEHLGRLGPVIHAEVGDEVEVLFKNNTGSPATMHAHGLRYDKGSEGSPYADGTDGDQKADDGVEPGQTHVYRWEVPERAGPGPHDPSSVMWMYHSHVDEVSDVYAGLMGAIIVTRRGEARPDGTPKGVDRELIVNFEVTDENSSPYLEENIARAGDPASVDPEDDDFVESNLMHGVNGYVYGNLPGLDVKNGERVRWYLMAMGTEVDLHTPHWHGNVVTAMGMRTDVVSLLPATMITADMKPDAPGTWLFHCHVADHISAGMQALFTVK